MSPWPTPRAQRTRVDETTLSLSSVCSAASTLQTTYVQHGRMAESNSADAATALAPAESFFGGAFFGLELPPGYTEPSEGIPDSWTGEFAETAGAAVLSRLHRASRGCRLWVLRHIPTLRLSLSNADGKPWGSDVLIVASALAVRGPRPTRVAVEYYGPQVQAAEGANHGFLEQVAEALAGDALTELHITCKRRSAMGQQAPAADVSDFVARVARACPRLASLTVTDAVCRLPPPTQLPSLTQFSTSRANSPSEACVTASCSTVPQYLAQLTSLHLKSAYVRLDSQGALWASIFSAQAPIAQHLTHLTIHVSLDDSAVDVLLAKAPSLQRVAVDSIDVQKVHTGQWAVERVQSRRDVTAKALACLPTRASGQTELVCPEVQFFESAEVRYFSLHHKPCATHAQSMHAVSCTTTSHAQPNAACTDHARWFAAHENTMRDPCTQQDADGPNGCVNNCVM